LAGGGTDSSTYLIDHGGFAMTAAIGQHIYIGINKMFDEGYRLKYSEIEYTKTIEDIKHPIIREALRLYRIQPGVEIVSMADIAAGTGLGSSGAFTVGLCRALAAFTHSTLHREDAAEQAARIELDILKRPGGKQDHWATAMGGVISLEFSPNGHIRDDALGISPHNLKRLESSLSLFFTGYSRDADLILATQSTEGLDEIKASAYIAQELLIAGDFEGFGNLMNEHWRLKQLRSPDMSNDHIDFCYRHALRNGAIGGKLVGAGGGGFLLFVAKEKAQLSAAMLEQGLQEIPVTFDHHGSTIIASER
jgi:D-glycero-alpha-D-manno-heptose-7-phosphate kinase